MNHSKNRIVAIALALTGIMVPGLHKFYLGQTRWGLVYLIPGVLWAAFPIAMIARAASLCDAIIYLSQGDHQFNQIFNPERTATLVTPESEAAKPDQVRAIAQALRQLDSLRQDGLITDYEFEQQRRQLLE